MARDYGEALEKLALLQSNRIITGLFESSSSSSSEKKSPRDLNAAAIPEMLTWLRRAGYTPRDLARMRHIHVAGTKGKGSVCAYATAMLAKYRAVGTYTSPHLVNVRERIAINGVPVGQEAFASAFFEVWDRLTEAAVKEGMPAAEAEGPASKPFYFRFLTILAWHIFLKEGIKDVVIECGIGGEYDATNVLPAEGVSAAVVTQLGIDHVAMLGDTVEKITWHKAGILKSGVKGFTMRLHGQPGVMEVLRKRAAEKGAELIEVEDAEVERWGGVSGVLKGDFQKRNQALAVMAVREHLGMRESRPLENIPEKMTEGLKEARLRGRCEVVSDGTVEWLLDGAHTKDSLEEAAKWCVRHHSSSGEDEPLVLVFNQQERDAAQLLADFVEAVEREAGRGGMFRHAIFTRNEPTRSPDGRVRGDTAVQQQAAEKMRSLIPGCHVKVFDNTADAVAEARRLAQGPQRSKRNRVLVTGSLHLVGSVLQVLEP
ncbi:folylpolyglutamate synthase [Trichoderma cornu-damae]|uniref:Folylpolyglutamate synthase n=1 Tax=Trichoderma cornu-damae TaxID=654480 RepID=A0A9P8QV64_9HYPO|nr:folylpolyglutamate synthase [Trichoderma cornu-damae]